jgi:hypothetical protein
MFNGRNVGVRQNLDGSVCFPPPYYDRCIYDLSSYSLDLYRLWTLYDFWNGMVESDLPQPTYTKQSPEPPPPPPPPVTPVVHEYNWPKDVNTSATFSSVANNGLAGSDPPQPIDTKQSPEPSPPPPVTPILHEYSWPKDVNTSATFSIVSTSGTVYLATMVWVQEGNVHFNSLDGDVRQIPLSSVSSELTQTANAHKNLNLRLPSAQAPTPDSGATAK